MKVNAIAALYLHLQTIGITLSTNPNAKVYTYLCTPEQFNAIELNTVVILPAVGDIDLPLVGTVVRKDIVPQIAVDASFDYKPIVQVVDTAAFDEVKAELKGFSDDLLRYEADRIRERVVAEFFGSAIEAERFAALRTGKVIDTTAEHTTYG